MLGPLSHHPVDLLGLFTQVQWSCQERRQKHTRPLEAQTRSWPTVSSTTFYFLELIIGKYWPCNGHGYRGQEVWRTKDIFAFNLPHTSTYVSQCLCGKERVLEPQNSFMPSWVTPLQIYGRLTINPKLLVSFLMVEKLSFQLLECRVPV